MPGGEQQHRPHTRPPKIEHVIYDSHLDTSSRCGARMRTCSRLLAMADAAGSTSDAGAPAHGGIGSASASSSAGAGAGAGAGAAAPAAPPTAAPAMGPEPPPGMQPVVATKKGSVEGRLAFQYKGRTVYEWEQNLEEVHVYITPPPGVRAKMLDVSIAPTHLKIGIKGNPPFINVRTMCACVYVRVCIQLVAPVRGRGGGVQGDVWLMAVSRAGGLREGGHCS